MSSTTTELQYSDLTDFKQVGSGSFGSVSRADYLGTDVAVKECFQSIPDYDFQNEARHPNIVQFMGTCINENRVYIITEFVSGGNLKEWIEKEKERVNADADDVAENEQHQQRLVRQLNSYRMRVSFSIDIARALAYLHARGIIHRDLKLENLLLTENGRVKVCDFGFSRVVKSATGAADNSKRKLSYVGTDAYMAPEIILCLDEYDTTVDIFSFGVVVLALISLNTPLNNGQPEAAPFTRLIPGFGLSESAIEAAVPRNIPMREKLTKMIIQCVDDDNRKRLPLKEALTILKEIETKLVQIIREEEERSGKYPSTLNVGIYHTLARGRPGSIFLYDSSQELPLPRTSLSELPQVGSVGPVKGTRAASLDTKLSISIVPAATPEIINSAPITHDQGQSAQINTMIRLKHDVPHRFSIVFSSISMHSLKCGACMKNIQVFMHSHLVCDDCGYVCHKKCARIVPPNCGLKLTNMIPIESSQSSINQSSNHGRRHTTALS